MNPPTAVKALSDQLHLSHSQMFTYLACSLKYLFRYVLGLPPEKISLALPFGSAIHKAIEHYYRALQEGGQAPLKHLQELFSERLSHELTEKKDLVVYKKDAPDMDSAIRLGCDMLEAFHTSIDLDGWQVVAVELPLSATLYGPDGVPTDFNLIGVIDLLLQDSTGNLLIVDHKTAARAKSQADVDADLQMTIYSYLLAANRYVFPTASVQCRFDVLRKLKAPKLEHYYTQRTAESRKRLAKIATHVLHGIETDVFIPNRSWMCADCEHAAVCADWHRS
jgi:putative RecB family exonuclease